MLLDRFFSREVKDSYQRSIAKTLSWRFLAACDTFAISYFVTGKLASAATIIGVEGVTKIVWYYLHERLWNHITWGRIPPPTIREVVGHLWSKYVTRSAAKASNGDTPPDPNASSQ
jgi:uncharacterized membrane protein